ncbi:MAG: DNA primase [Alphaproteobacteria bacterium]|nr:DNA primase [Alphaproteobacteria bacterium]
MAFPPRFLDDIRDRVGLADVVGRRVKLVRKGREHSGLCPFHNEKTPSFTVNEDKGFYHCFGCGAHGDIFSFIQNTENLNFPESVEQLAGLAGLAMPEETPEEREREKKRVGLAEAVEAAAQWFSAQLRTESGKAALDYLTGRGLDDATINRFRLGFAPGKGDALKHFLIGQGFSEDVLVEAGLLGRPDDGRPTYDRMRGRVIFPIVSRKGRVVAFGGRILEGDGAKYLNSPETPLFHKGRMLYNMNHAAPAVHDDADLIVAEGYMDVIALDRAGFHGAVAPLGTALTEDQIEALWKQANEPILCFDGDEAGGRAAARAADRALPLLRPGKSLRFAMLPSGQDPDDLIASGGPAAMRQVLDGARPLSDLLWRLELDLRPADTPERKADLQHRLEARARQIEDETVQGHYRSAFRERLWAHFQTARRQAAKPRGRVPPRTQSGGLALSNKEILRRRSQQVVLATLLGHPELADEFSDLLSHANFEPDLDKLLQALQKQLAANPDLDSETLKRHLSQEGFATLMGVLCADDVMVHAVFARHGGSVEAARVGLRDVLAFIFQGRRREELVATARYTAEHPDDESEKRFLAFRKDVELGESQILEAGDEMDNAGNGNDGG